MKSETTTRKSRLPAKEDGGPANPGTENSEQRGDVEVSDPRLSRQAAPESRHDLGGGELQQTDCMRKQILVVNHPEGWAVKRPGSERASFVTKTQAGSIDLGRRLSQAEGSELTIQGRDGKFRDSDSHGSDPCPPRG